MILWHVFVIFAYFYIAIFVSNIATKMVEKYCKNKYCLIVIHIYIIALFYYLYTISPMSFQYNTVTLFFVGPLIGIYSNYFNKDFLR